MSPSDKRAWISGPARESGYGSADVTFPDTEGPLAGTVKNMTMYEPVELSEPLAIPFHDQCRDLLLKQTGEAELDAEAFYETVCSLSGGSCCLDKLQYGKIADEMDQYWGPAWGREWFVMSPLDIPDLQLYYNDLPKIGEGPSAQGRHIELRSAVNDPFSRLPFEVLEQILGELPLASIRKLRLASRAVRNQELPNRFWKKLVRRDMDFLFDMPDTARNATDVDWRWVYRDMSRRSNPKRRKLVGGLANRARIWKETLPQIAEPYMRNLAAKQCERANEPSVFKGAKNEGLASLVLPEPKDARTTNIAFMSMPHLLHRAKLELVISFNEFDEIANLDAINHAESTLAESTRALTGRIEKVHIPNDSWVTGIIVTTATREVKDSMATHALRRVVGLDVLLTKPGASVGEGASVKVGCQRGDKKVIHVPEGDFIVGLKVRQSPGSGVLCRLGLFCHQSWRAGANNYRQRSYNDDKYSLVQGRMWHHQLPRQGPGSGGGPAPGEPHSGYWDFGLVADVEPMQHLIWDAVGYTRSHITSISADVLFGGFRVTYDNQPDRTIGPCLNAMKTLTIDAAGGEGILCIYYCISHIPTSIRFVTTRNRQLVIGQPDGRENRFPARESPNKRLPGFFAHWSKLGSSPPPNLKAIGGFYSPSNWLEMDVSPEASQQVGGPRWEPTGLAEGLATSGSCIGAFTLLSRQMSARNKSVPDDSQRP
ncbi:uncharacterized protein F5Z01DRAFT_487536 [Emericellopsis atlantica]|uniref:F-box domain-containing protein n=1 Tax=Emericellopsis atlantica TaxID=2614577 RepID=A0A9P8CS31_9HYPO|nr:uncharacterized protein F5Z01DRAFT_487536 [Emericellopsis atlantica]KAG9256770.1 hypothetical protein F5Z01DRAFT_487536 [Emericellopsis atlantica]